LKSTPLGSDYQQVLSFCTSKRLKCHSSETSGYLNQDTNRTVGVQSVWGVVQESKAIPFFQTTTEAFWGFDANGKLIDVWIWKTNDSL
jgi:hypothetical protein